MTREPKEFPKPQGRGYSREGSAVALVAEGYVDKKPDWAKAKHSFTRMPNEILDSHDWRSLPNGAKILYECLQKRNLPGRNGSIGMSVREAAKEVGSSVNGVAKWFRLLMDHGWIERTRKGQFHGGFNHAALWKLKAPWAEDIEALLGTHGE